MSWKKTMSKWSTPKLRKWAREDLGRRGGIAAEILAERILLEGNDPLGMFK